MAGVERPSMAEKGSELEEKLLAAIKKHRDGIMLSAAAEIVEIAPVVLGRAAKSLVEKGLIRKEQKLYFPVENK
jgi:DNA-binding MarR family transcriptional regulator